VKAGVADIKALLSNGSITGLKLKPPANYSGDVVLTVRSTEQDGTAEPITTTLPITVSVNGVPDTPTFTISGTKASGNEDTAIALPNVTFAALTDTSETLTVSIEGIPDGAVLKSGGTSIEVKDRVATLSPS